MPTLKWFPSEGSPRAFLLHKPVSTIGRALGNDVAVPSAGLADTHAQVLFDGRDFNLEEIDKQGEILINGKKKRRARLVHGDRLTLGDVQITFSMFDEPQRSASGGGHAQTAGDGAAPGGSGHEPKHSTTSLQLSGLRKLYEFSEKLMTMRNLDELL